jgi:hypothetical protein
MGGFLKGLVGLALLEAVLSSKAATDRASGVVTIANKVLAWIVSPFIPAIPDRSKGK